MKEKPTKIKWYACCLFGLAGGSAISGVRSMYLSGWAFDGDGRASILLAAIFAISASAALAYAWAKRDR